MLEQGRCEQWIFTFDSATGEVRRVEKLDPVSGSSQELSEAEYAALNSYLGALALKPEPEVPNPSASTSIAAHRAYWQGMADCAALYRQHRYSG